MKKNMIALIAGAAALCIMAAGCGSQTTGTAGSAAASTASTADAAATTAAAEETPAWQEDDTAYLSGYLADIYDVPSRVCWQADIDKLQSNYDLVIFNFHAEFLSEWGVPHMLIWASHLFDKKKKLIVNYGSPYFAVNYFPEDPTIIEMNCSPSETTVEMLAAGILGEKEFTGKTVLLHR